jgi:hypothetical protein
MKKFFIKKGHHWSGFHFGLYFGKKKVSYRFRFSDQCYYPIIDSDDYDINKLFGFAYWTLRKLPPHHYNSIRIGWRPARNRINKIDLFLYLYNKGERIMILFPMVDTGKDYIMEINTGGELTNSDKSITFKLKDDNEQLIHYQSCDFVFPKFRWGYNLFFYFGGNKTAPHDLWAWVGKE